MTCLLIKAIINAASSTSS